MKHLYSKVVQSRYATCSIIYLCRQLLEGATTGHKVFSLYFKLNYYPWHSHWTSAHAQIHFKCHSFLRIIHFYLLWIKNYSKINSLLKCTACVRIRSIFHCEIRGSDGNNLRVFIINPSSGNASMNFFNPHCIVMTILTWFQSSNGLCRAWKCLQLNTRNLTTHFITCVTTRSKKKHERIVDSPIW